MLEPHPKFYGMFAFRCLKNPSLVGSNCTSVLILDTLSSRRDYYTYTFYRPTFFDGAGESLTILFKWHFRHGRFWRTQVRTEKCQVHVTLNLAQIFFFVHRKVQIADICHANLAKGKKKQNLRRFGPYAITEAIAFLRSEIIPLI